MARLTSVQGKVEIRWSESEAWRDAGLSDVLCIGSTIRVGAYSRAALVLADDSTLRIDQNTTLVLREREDERRTWLEMITGAIHFFSHRPRSLNIDTPFVNAAAEGTEFLIRIGADEAHILMYEGVVLASNAAGELRLGPDDAALIRRGEKPIPQIVVRPRDAVAWAVYYPPVIPDLAAGAEPGAYPVHLDVALRRVQQNNYPSAIRTLDLVPEDERDARHETLRAGIFLNIGRVQEAEAAIERALALDGDNADAYALRTILHLVRNDRAQAIRDADRAVRLAPNSSAGLIAQSYARQASFDLEGARDSLREATQKNPNDALAFARLAEIELSFADYDRANEAADQAVFLAPNLARTQTVQGFSELAAINTDAAQKAFARAIELYSADPLPHLGQGLAKIRDGDLEAGRRDLEIAASLDPNNALIRSYLGKAYFEEKRGPKDATQFEIAKKLDPNDPTPYLYDAIRKQSENRPIEALRDLQTSIELNDNRAVYRSKLLMDEDLAVRSARLGRVYSDLGFEQLALLQGWRSTVSDPTNYSGHRLLADAYRTLPGHEIARDSELLISQLLQPINLNPVQPRLPNDGLDFLDETGPSNTTFAEYSPLFVSNSLNIYSHGILGNNNTKSINVIGAGIYDRQSLSVGYSRFETDGTRVNNDLLQEIQNAFWQGQLTRKTSVQIEARQFDREQGDRFEIFFDENFSETARQRIEDRSLRIGFAHQFSPGSTIIGSYIRNNNQNDLFTGLLNIEGEAEGDFVELRYFGKLKSSDITMGAGYWNAQEDLDTFLSGTQIGDVGGRGIHRNAYAYGYYNPVRDLSLILGLSGDSFDDLFLTETKKQLNPKFGLIWEIGARTTLRLAAFRTLQRSLISSQTIEPTIIAGFNQFFFDSPVADSYRYGIGLDRSFDLDRRSAGDDLYAGVEISKSDISFPVLDPLTNEVDDIGIDDILGRAYLSWLISKWLSLSIEYQYEKSQPNRAAINLTSFPDVRTHRVPIEADFSFRRGGFYRLKRHSLTNTAHSQTLKEFGSMIVTRQ